MATSRALWEAAVESRIASLPSGQLFSDATGISDGENQRHSNEPEKVFLGKLNRIPGELLKEFAEGASLRPCRDALLAEGLPWKLGSGAMIFVYPWQHSQVMVALGDKKLHPDHVVFTESVEHLVAEVLEPHKSWMRARSSLDAGIASRNVASSSSRDSGRDADAGSDGGRGSGPNNGEFAAPWAPLVIVERSFLCLASPPVGHDSAVTVSSIDAHSPGANPRRVPVPDM